MPSEAAIGAAPASARRSAAVLGVAIVALAITSASAMRAVFSPVQDLAKAELGLSDLQLSLVQGLAASIPIALLSIPIGRMTDRNNRVHILIALAALWTLGTAATALANDFTALFIARMLAGVGAMCAVPVAISIVADLSAPEQRGRALMLLSLGNMAGAAAAFTFGGQALGFAAQSSLEILQAREPWRGVHILFAVASAALLVLLFAVREPARREIKDGALAFAPAMRAIWARRAFLAPLFLGQVTVVMADLAASIWAAPVLTRAYGQTPESFAGWMGLVILASGIVGSLIGGFAADAAQKFRHPRGVLIPAVIAAALSVPAAAFPLLPGVGGFGWTLALFLTCGAITGLVTATAIAVLVPNEIRGVCLGAFVVLGAVVGLGLAPTAVALISDALGGGGAVRYGLAVTCGVTSVLATIGFVAAMRAPDDAQPTARAAGFDGAAPT